MMRRPNVSGGEFLSSLSRRRALQGIGAAALASSLRKTANAAEGKVFPATTVNHLAYISAAPVPAVRDFYIDFFGMVPHWDDGNVSFLDAGPSDAPNSIIFQPAKPGVKPTIGHMAWGLPTFWENKYALKAEMERRGYKGIREDGEAGWFVDAPSGYSNQPMTVADIAIYPGAANTCKTANSPTDKRTPECLAGRERGIRNLASLPKPSGRGFNAKYFNYILLRVQDVAAERDFHVGLFGMKILTDKKDDVALRFGDNTLVLRRAAQGAGPSCNEFGLAVEDYDEGRAKAELSRRGITARPSPFGGLVFNDPNGLEVGISGKA